MGRPFQYRKRKRPAPSSSGCTTPRLHNRLVDHTRSLQQVPSLDIADFYCRHLIVDEEWVRWGESMLIDRFKPVWNVVLDGFGNHDPGRDRYNGMRPAWDTVHPGRYWPGKLRRNKRSAAALREAVRQHLE